MTLYIIYIYLMKITIYAIFSMNDINQENVYIGSTQNIRNREYQHKNACHNNNIKSYNKPLYKYIRANGGWDEMIMEKIITTEVADKVERYKLESDYIELFEAKLNKYKPGRLIQMGKSQYQKEYMKDYFEVNKDKIRQQIKAINKQQMICPFCKISFTKGHKLNHQKNSLQC